VPHQVMACDGDGRTGRRRVRRDRSDRSDRSVTSDRRDRSVTSDRRDRRITSDRSDRRITSDWRDRRVGTRDLPPLDGAQMADLVTHDRQSCRPLAGREDRSSDR